MKRIIPYLVIALSLSICGTAWGDDYKDGLVAFQRGDLATALKKYRTAAKNGHRKANSVLEQLGVSRSL